MEKSRNEYHEREITPDKNKHAYVVGIDFGHGETSAAYAEIGWDNDRANLKKAIDIDLPQDKTYVIPSAIAICTDGSCRIGADAFEYPDAEIHVCFKQRPVSIEGKAEQLMIKFMRAVYEQIRERVGAILTDTNHIVYIATPSGWDKTAQTLYKEMAAKAGMPIAVNGIMYESRAAFINAQCSEDSGLPQYVDKGAIVFDMGSSTLDFTYISTEVIRDNQKPIDFGYDCGASAVEKIMYEKLRDDHMDVISEFEKEYPKATDRLLFEMRRGKEEYFRKEEHRIRKTIDFYTLVNDEDLDIIRCTYNQGDLEKLLASKNYIEKIRNAMRDYVENHISGKPIYAAFFTGGASRMDFLEDLVKELWHVNYVFRDQNPSLTISQGVAEAARSDIRSGGIKNIKTTIQSIMSDIDVYSVFAEKLGEKIRDEIQASIAGPVQAFKDNAEDSCLGHLESAIKTNIEQDVNNIGIWAKESMEEAFREATHDIYEKMNTKMANYSKSAIKMKDLSTKGIEISELNLNVIEEHIQVLSNEFIENASEWTNIFTGAAVGAVAAFLFSGPIGWIAGGLTLAYKLIFGDTETEEEKREKAKWKSLDYEARTKVYNEFANNWENICSQINDAIDNALNNPNLKSKINMRCNSILREYAEECLRQTRTMLN